MPRTRVELAVPSKRADEIVKNRKEVAKEEAGLHELSKKLDKGAEAQLLGDILPTNVEERNQEHQRRHHTFDPRGAPTREEKKRRRNNRHRDTREERENDRKRGSRWIARENADIGGLQGRRARIRHQPPQYGDDIASYNMGVTPPPHDTPATADKHAASLPQAESKEAYRRGKQEQAVPKVPKTPPAPPPQIPRDT